MKRILALLLLASIAAQAEPLRVLAIGNSFSKSLCRYLPKAAVAAGKDLEFCNLYIGGCSLQRHAENIAKGAVDPAFKPYDVQWYRAPEPTQAVTFKANIPEMLATQKWDIVTIQQASHHSWNPESYHPWGESLIATIRTLAPDAEIVVHQTWAYNPADGRIGGEKPSWGFDRDGMYERVEAAYLAFAKERRLRVIPVGLAVQFERTLLFHANDQVFDPATIAALAPGEKADMRGEPVGSFWWKDGKLQRDTIHLNRTGDYLQAMVWLGFLFDCGEEELAAIDYEPDEVVKAAGGPNADGAEPRALREVAADALQLAREKGWQDFAPKKVEPPTLVSVPLAGDKPQAWTVFVMPKNGVVDAATTPPTDPADLSFAIRSSYDKDGFYVYVRTFDDDVSTDSCEPGATSCPAWDDDAVEVFLDGEYARLPDSRADGGVHLKHGGEFSLVANGAAMSDYSGYPNSYMPPQEQMPDDFGVATDKLWSGFVQRDPDGEYIPEALLKQLGAPADFAPGSAKETEYAFYFSWAAMGRTNAPERIGFNVGVQDDDGGGRRDHALYWTGNPQRPFSDERAFGTLVFEPRDGASPVPEDKR